MWPISLLKVKNCSTETNYPAKIRNMRLLTASEARGKSIIYKIRNGLYLFVFRFNNCAWHGSTLLLQNGNRILPIDVELDKVQGGENKNEQLCTSHVSGVLNCRM